MKFILCSLLFVAVNAMPGPLVNTTMHVIQPIGDTFATAEITTAAPKIVRMLILNLFFFVILNIYRKATSKKRFYQFLALWL